MKITDLLFDPFVRADGVAVTPAAHGFLHCSTGGGCTAWQKEVPEGVVVLTDHDLSAPTEPGEGWIIALYPDEQALYEGRARFAVTVEIAGD